MKFLHLHLFYKVEFGNIEGYDDIKDFVRRALDSHENYNLRLCGPPASGRRPYSYLEYGNAERMSMAQTPLTGY